MIGPIFHPSPATLPFVPLLWLYPSSLPRDVIPSPSPWRNPSSIPRDVTLRPASLLCSWISVVTSARPRFLRRLASMNSRDFWYPNSTLSPQPPHSHSPSVDMSRAWFWHVHCSSPPRLQACVTAYTTPAAVMAYRKADSRVSGKHTQAADTVYKASQRRRGGGRRGRSKGGGDRVCQRPRSRVYM